MKGFTLIEIAIVLLVMSIVSMGVMQTMTGMALNARYSEIHRSFDTLKGGIVWNSFKARACVPPETMPCNTATYSYPLPANGMTFTAMGFGPPLTKDPWGKDYAYAVTTPVVSTTSLPGDVAFTMTSAGVDGVFGTTDDLKKQILVSELQAMFSRF